ncbi:transporter substrate-binding domain-containing protein [Desulfobacterales bacterium HSG16]|nr:transporter substrate-binding domain-containing protein [Desulfobacterales bacterium HSG16]
MRNKKYKNIILKILLVILCGFPVYGYAETTIRVGMYQNEPLIFKDKGGQVKGMYADILSYVAEKEGWRIEYGPDTWPRCLDGLEAGTVDMVVAIAHSRKRELLYDFTQETVLSNWGQLYTLKNSEIQSIHALRQKTIAMMKGDIYYQEFMEILRRFDINVQIMEVNDYASVLKCVSMGKADAGLASRLFGVENMKKYGICETSIVCCPIELRFALPKGKNPKLAETLDRYLVKLKQDKDSIYYQSLNVWFRGVRSSGIPVWILWAFGLTCGLLLLLLGGNFVLKAQVRSRTKALEEEIGERKRAEAQVRKHRDHLEDIVAKRTRELTDSNDDLRQEISKRTQMEHDLREAKETAESANQAKSEFLASMSHELRTPLNGILGYAQILNLKNDLTEFQKKGVQIIERSGKHLLNLINGILDLSKIEAKKLELNMSNFQFLAFLDDIMALIRIQAEKKNLTCHVETDARLPEAVCADEKRLGQILLNLLGNAVKFTQHGSVTLRVTQVSSDERRLADDNTSRSEQSTIRFEIQDTGVGVSNHDLEDIFSMFKQVGEHTRAVEGTGLGLAISRQLIRLMGAELFVKSAVDKGSTFWFDMKLPEVSEWNAHEKIHNNRVIGFTCEHLEGVPKILIVDDKWENRALLVSLMVLLGFEVSEAANGQDALQKVTSFQPDLIFMDLVMPVMDGFEAVRQIRKSSSLKHIKIIAASASTLMSPERIRSEFGFDEFLHKPLQIPKVLDSLARYLHVEWVYESKSEPAQDEKDNTASVTSSLEGQENEMTMLIPPRSELDILYDLTLDGDFKALRKHLDRLEETELQYRQFTQHIRIYAENLNEKTICEFLNQYRGEES